MVIDFGRLLLGLAEEEVRFTIVDSVALVLHGSARVTQDLSICYARDDENLFRMCRALGIFSPGLRGAARTLPFRLDVATLKAGLNLQLQTDAGDVNLLGEVTGVGGFAEVAATADMQMVYGVGVLVISLAGLERARLATGRLTDLVDLAEIRILQNRRPR